MQTVPATYWLADWYTVGTPQATAGAVYYVKLGPDVDSTHVSAPLPPIEHADPHYLERGGGRWDRWCGNRPPRRSRFEGARHHQQPKLRATR